MKKHFVRALIVNAAVQFAVTRTRAGRVEEEGGAEALWLRYPFVVVANALIWAIMFSTVGRVVRALRSNE